MEEYLFNYILSQPDGLDYLFLNFRVVRRSTRSLRMDLVLGPQRYDATKSEGRSTCQVGILGLYSDLD